MKAIIWITFITVCVFIFVGGDMKKAAISQLEIEEQNKELVIRMFKEMDKKNFDFVKKQWTTNHKIYGMGSFKAKKVEHMGFNLFYNAFPDYTHTIEDIFAEGDKVVVRMRAKGTHENAFLSIPPTDKEIEFGEMMIIRIANGKFVEGWILEDSLWMYRQLGMELKLKD